MIKLMQSLLVVMFMVLLGGKIAMAIEEAQYTIALQQEPYELRKYTSQLIAETTVDSDFEGAGGEAFKRLFEYISGNNSSQQSIEMTSPVGQTSSSRKIEMTAPVTQKSQSGKWVVSFMMPANFTLETLPKPKDPKVILRQVPSQHIAAIQYSGFWSEEGFLENRALLEEWIGKMGFITSGEPIWARYNPPFMPWFLRRNEILIPVYEPKK